MIQEYNNLLSFHCSIINQRKINNIHHYLQALAWEKLK